MSAFGYCEEIDLIELVYPKIAPDNFTLKKLIEKLVKFKTSSGDTEICNEMTIEMSFSKAKINDDDDDENHNDYYQEYNKKEYLITDLIMDMQAKREFKINQLNAAFQKCGFPKLEGDKVTFIGTTFVRHGEKTPFLNHCIVLNDCHPIKDVDNCVIEEYSTEKEVLLAWQKLIMRQNPDFIMGYNIFGFDYEFMYQRAIENNCVEQFLKLSKKNEICGTKDNFQNKEDDGEEKEKRRISN